MRIVTRHIVFRKNYKKRILPNKNLDQRYEKRLAMFLEDPHDPKLHDHQLTGSKSSFRAFSVTGDIRVVYRIEGEEVMLYDIGTHNQVY